MNIYEFRDALTKADARIAELEAELAELTGIMPPWIEAWKADRARLAAVLALKPDYTVDLGFVLNERAVRAAAEGRNAVICRCYRTWDGVVVRCVECRSS